MPVFTFSLQPSTFNLNLVAMNQPRKSQKSKANHQKARVRLWSHLHLIAYMLFVALLLTVAIGSTLFAFISLNIPNLGSLAAYRPAQTSMILDDNDQVVATYHSQNRIVVDISLMPDLLAKAFIAAEDGRFHDHRGVDTWSILRAVIHNIKAGGKAQGGSTITQQVARSLLLTPEKTYTRKIKEAILAYRIDSVLSKDEIMHIYLNQIYLGEGAYGVEAAARTYYDKNVSELNLAEMSLLAGLPQAPSRYSPFKNYKLAKMRQRYVLNRMAEDGYISPTAARRAYTQVLLWASPSTRKRGRNGYFIQQVRNYVENKYGTAALNSGGLLIYTTLDGQLQKVAAKAVNKGIGQWRGRNPAKKVSPQAALVAIDIASGKIKAVVGGSNFKESQFNRAVQARRQPGSAFKPIVYAAAFAAGLTPATIIEDAPLELQGAKEGDIWQPQNFSGEFYGPTTLKTALVKSRNVVTIKLLQQVGITPTVALAQKLGIKSPLAENLSMALGAADMSLLELTAAYTAFADGGIYKEPFFIEKIVDPTGKVLESHKNLRRRALDARVAFQITNMLESVIAEGTGRNARGLEFAAAGKTGTTDENVDAWFIGYTPGLACGVWMGYDQQESLGSAETGGRAVAPIWLDFMKRAMVHIAKPGASSLRKWQNFKVPQGITFLGMNTASGRIGAGQENLPLVPFLADNLPLPPIESGSIPGQEKANDQLIE